MDFLSPGINFLLDEASNVSIGLSGAVFYVKEQLATEQSNKATINVITPIREQGCIKVQFYTKCTVPNTVCAILESNMCRLHYIFMYKNSFEVLCYIYI